MAMTEPNDNPAPDGATLTTRVLEGELRTAIETAVSDLRWLEDAVKHAIGRLEQGECNLLLSDASQVGQSARSAVDSMMRTAIVRGKIQGAALAQHQGGDS